MLGLRGRWRGKGGRLCCNIKMRLGNLYYKDIWEEERGVCIDGI